MEISFPDEDSQRLFEGQTRLRGKFGDELAALICCRISILRAAPNLALVPHCRPVELRSDGRGAYSVALDTSFRLAFQASAGSGTRKTRRTDEITHIQLVGIIDA